MKAAEAATVATTESYTRPALDRLLDIALEISSEEARCAADFLLWWYDADAYGAINIVGSLGVGLTAGGLYATAATSVEQTYCLQLFYRHCHRVRRAIAAPAQLATRLERPTPPRLCCGRPPGTKEPDRRKLSSVCAAWSESDC